MAAHRLRDLWRTSKQHWEGEKSPMDDKTTGASGKMYAVALSVLEELRGPSLAVAATGGPLLLRIKRLLAADGTGGSDG